MRGPSGRKHLLFEENKGRKEGEGGRKEKER